MKTFASITAILSIFLIGLSGSTQAKTSFYYKDIPPSIDTSQKYIFFLHGLIVEKKGPHAESKKYGRYEYYNILKAFSDRGFIVISEARRRGTDIQQYASKVADPIRTLMAAGVAPERITVIGYSRGATITLRTSSILGEPKVNFVVLAGCGHGKYKKKYQKRFEEFVKPIAPDLRGRFLSIYDDSDKISGSCQKAFDLAPEGLEYDEKELKTHLGHGLFFTPREDWLDIVVEWVK